MLSYALQHRFDTADAHLVLFQSVIVGVRLAVVFPCLAQSAFLGVTDLFMGQVVTDELVHEVGHGRSVPPVSGLHRGAADVPAPLAERPEHLADMPVMVLVTEEMGVSVIYPLYFPRVIFVPPGVAFGVLLGDPADGVFLADPCEARQRLACQRLMQAILPAAFPGFVKRQERLFQNPLPEPLPCHSRIVADNLPLFPGVGVFQRSETFRVTSAVVAVPRDFPPALVAHRYNDVVTDRVIAFAIVKLDVTQPVPAILTVGIAADVASWFAFGCL